MLSALVFAVFLYVSGIGHNAEATIGGMVDGTASRPYVYRALVPAAVRALVAITPAGIDEVLQRSGALTSLFSRMLVPREEYLEGFYCLVLMYGSLVGHAFAFGALYGAAVGDGRRAQQARLWGPLCTLPFFGFGYLYDFTTLLLATLAWLCLVRRSWRWFSLVYLASCINKETTILMSLAFCASQYGQLPRGIFWRLLGYQLVMFGLVRAALVRAYGANPGSAFQFHLHEQLAALSSLGAVLIWGLVLVGVARLVIRGWPHKSVVLRRSLVAALLPLLVLFALFGYPFEWRVFYEVLPLIVLLALPVSEQAASAAGQPVSARA